MGNEEGFHIDRQSKPRYMFRGTCSAEHVPRPGPTYGIARKITTLACVSKQDP